MAKRNKNLKADPKKTWSLINDLREKSTTSSKYSFMIRDERINCRRIMGNKFNEYFVSLDPSATEPRAHNSDTIV